MLGVPSDGIFEVEVCWLKYPMKGLYELMRETLMNVDSHAEDEEEVQSCWRMHDREFPH